VTYDLDGDVFWKLSALCERTRGAADRAAAARDALAAAQRAQHAYLDEVAKGAGFDPKVEQFALDDEALTLTIPDPTKGTP
jgi:hypothetical protein